MPRNNSRAMLIPNMELFLNDLQQKSFMAFSHCVLAVSHIIHSIILFTFFYSLYTINFTKETHELKRTLIGTPRSDRMGHHFGLH